MTHLTQLTDYFTESSRVLRTHGTREKVTNKCVKSVKLLNHDHTTIMDVEALLRGWVDKGLSLLEQIVCRNLPVDFPRIHIIA